MTATRTRVRAVPPHLWVAVRTAGRRTVRPGAPPVVPVFAARRERAPPPNRACPARLLPVAAPLVLRPGDESRLRTVLRCSTAGAGVAQRARIVLLAAEGVSNAEIGRRVGVSRPTVLSWRGRYEQSSIAGLGDLDRSGRPPVIDDLAVVVATLAAPPASLGVTHWSARLLGRHLGISFASVARIWREHDLKPWKRETFKFSTDPELDAKVRDVVGLYLNPRAPRGADDLSGGERPSPPDLSQQGR